MSELHKNNVYDGNGQRRSTMLMRPEISAIYEVRKLLSSLELELMNDNPDMKWCWKISYNIREILYKSFSAISRLGS